METRLVEFVRSFGLLFALAAFFVFGARQLLDRERRKRLWRAAEADSHSVLNPGGAALGFLVLFLAWIGSGVLLAGIIFFR